MISNLTPTHIHLLLNHVPTIGFGIAMGLLIGALVSRSDDLKKAALTVLVAVALLTLPTYLTGNAAEESIRNLPGVSRTLIATHEGAALVAFIFMEITGAVAWLALWQFHRRSRMTTRTFGTVLVLAVITMGLVTRAANVGGEIRHTEIQLAVETTTAEGPVGRDLATWVKAVPWVWPAAESLHFVGLSLLMGVVLLIDLRMLGVMKQVSVKALDRLIPWAILGFGINVVTGMLFFVAAPEQYTQNIAFFWKIGLLIVAVFNGLYFTVYDKAWELAPGADAAPLSKVMAASALLLWVGVMYYGSMLPFIGNAF
ncbi:MAG: hypothetical protein EXQ48_07605 [Acidobacteria bacterium]|nr:hypothetical protein [Acidobacteriota bacterium]